MKTSSILGKMLERENPNQLEKYIETNIDLSDPLHLDQLSVTERYEYLDTKEERQEYRAMMISVGIMDTVSEIIKENVDTVLPTEFEDRIGLDLSQTEKGFYLKYSRHTLEKMNNRDFLWTYFRNHSISKTQFVFSSVGEAGENIPTESPDEKGIQDTLSTGLLLATVEMDRRLQVVYSKRQYQERLEQLSKKTRGDLTGFYYLNKIYIPSLKKDYFEIIGNMEKVESMRPEELPYLIQALSYPSSLFTLDVYRELINEQLKLY